MTFEREPDGNWFLKGLMGIMGGDDNYDKRVVGRDEVDGLIISTAWTSDEGYETAVCHSVASPVERYKTIEEATTGHKKWVKRAKTLTHIRELGTGDGIISSKKIKIERQ